MHLKSESYVDVFDKDSLVYLTAGVRRRGACLTALTYVRVVVMQVGGGLAFSRPLDHRSHDLSG